MPNVYELLGLPTPKEEAPVAPSPVPGSVDRSLTITSPPQPARTAPPPAEVSPSVAEAMATPERPQRGYELAIQGIRDIAATPQEEVLKAAREAAANVVRYSSAAIQLPAFATPGLGPALYSMIGGLSEGGAQYIQHGEIRDPYAVGAAALVPPVVSGAVSGVRAALPRIAPRIPGAAATLGQWAVEKARGVLPPMMPSTSARALYQRIAAGPNPRIPAQNMLKAAHEVLQGELQLVPELQGPLKTHAEAIIQLYKDHGGQVPFKEMLAHLQKFRQLSKMVKRAGGAAGTPTQAHYGTLASGIADDMLDAGLKGTAGKASAALRVANESYRKQKAIAQLTKSIESGIEKGRPDALTTINPAKPLNLIDENKFLRESFSPAELGEIKAVLGEVRGMPTLPPPQGEATVQGKQLVRMMVGGGIGGAAGASQGYPEVGTMVGLAAPGIIAAAVATPAGRTMLLKMLRANQGVLDERALRVLGQFARGATGGLLEEE